MSDPEASEEREDRGGRSELPEPSVGLRIQRLIDDLGARLGMAASIDDPDFQLQFYSPQHGTIDRVRMESILLRDSPPAAKAWVTEHGVTRAEGPVRVPPAEHLGLLPRLGIPIDHQAARLGYLWIIDAESRLDAAGVELARLCTTDLGPLLFRWRFFDRLDRRTERGALTDLLDPRDDVRRRGASSLTTPGQTPQRPARVLVVRPLGHTSGDAANPALAAELALELALERARARLAPLGMRFIRPDHRAVVLLTGPAATESGRTDGPLRRIHASLRSELDVDRVVIGVGQLVEQLHDAARSFAGAQDAAEIATRDPTRGDIVGARLLGVERTVLHMPAEEREDLVRTLLGPLTVDRDAVDLMATLEAFLEEAGDIAAVAGRLDLHRSSVYPRLRRIERLIEVDLRDGRDRAAVHFAIVARRLSPSAPQR
jgi:hypothetical protein